MRRLLTYFVALPVFWATMGAAPAGNTNPPNQGPATQQNSAQAPASPGAIQKTAQAFDDAFGEPYQVGYASWYGEEFEGKPTASGEPFDMNELTAAHRDLPLGTRVKVTSLDSGESVVVRINDRGPVPKDRIIDLSYRAARKIHVSGLGVAMVRLDLVTPESVAFNNER
jgi:rare lipoprotein A